MEKRVNIIPASALIGASYFLSKVLGLLKGRLLLGIYGATRAVEGTVSELDTFNAAFKIPDFIYQLLILGTVSSVFIPTFTSLRLKDSAKAWKLTSNVLTAGILFMGGLSFFAFVFASKIVPVIAPGFRDNPEALVLTVLQTRILLLNPIIFTLSSIASSLLNSFKKFMAYSLAPLAYNAGIIFGIVFFVPKWGIIGAAWGAVLGALLHLLIQLPSVFKTGFRYRPILDLKDLELIKMAKQAIPRVLAIGSSQINILVETAIASTLAAGSITIFTYAQDLQMIPLGLISLPLAIAIFAVFVELSEPEKKAEFDMLLSKRLRLVLYLIMPCLAGILLLRAEIVRLVYGTGRFSWTDTVLMANTLGILAISLFAQALIPLLTRVYYAKQNTKTPVIFSMISVALNILLSFTLAYLLDWGLIGLALAFSCSSILNMILLFWALPRHNITLKSDELIISVVKITFATLCTAAMIQISKWSFTFIYDQLDTFLKVASKTSAAILVGAISYLLITQLLRSRELAEILERWKKN